MKRGFLLASAPTPATPKKRGRPPNKAAKPPLSAEEVALQLQELSSPARILPNCTAMTQQQQLEVDGKMRQAMFGFFDLAVTASPTLCDAVSKLVTEGIRKDPRSAELQETKNELGRTKKDCEDRSSVIASHIDFIKKDIDSLRRTMGNDEHKAKRRKEKDARVKALEARLVALESRI